jgi:hypothetical protein
MSNLRTRNGLPHNFVDGIAIKGIDITHLKDLSMPTGSTMVGHNNSTVKAELDTLYATAQGLIDSINVLQNSLNTTTVKLTGDQTVSGTKTFTSTVLGSSAVESGFAAVKTGTGASQTKLFNNQTSCGITDSDYGSLLVKDKANNQLKVFEALHLPGNATANLQAVPKQQLDAAILAVTNQYTPGSSDNQAVQGTIVLGNLRLRWGSRYIGDIVGSVQEFVVFDSEFDAVPDAVFLSFRDTSSTGNSATAIGTWKNLSSAGFEINVKETTASNQNVTVFWLVIGWQN